MQMAIITQNKAYIAPILLLSTVVPYYMTAYMHKWTKTDTKKNSKTISYIILGVWFVYAAGTYLKDITKFDHESIIAMVIWASVLFVHYNIMNRKQIDQL